MRNPKSLRPKTKKMNKRKIIKRVLYITALVTVAAILGVSIYTACAARIAVNAVPMPFGVGVAVALTNSMEPEFSGGDLLIVTESESYEVGDVVVFQTKQVAISHRIVAINGDDVITKGDSNNLEDDPIRMEHIKGKVLFSIPLLGYVVNVIKSPIGTIAILALAIWMLEYSFRMEKKKDSEELDRIKSEIEKLKQEQDNNSQ